MAPAADLDQREKELKAFNESKAGVKGLADAGITKLPGMFIHPPEDLQNSTSPEDDQCAAIRDNIQVPVIDIRGFDQSERRKEIMNDIGKAAETWGFFQILNHGIPVGVMDELLEGVRRFHELPQEEKAKWYTNDFTQRVNFFSQAEFKASKPVDWRDTLSCKVLEDPQSFEEIPQVCRREISEYMKYIEEVQGKLSGLFAEALGLSTDHLESIGCFKTRSLACHYFPICPEPHLTMGGTKHTDLGFLTLLLQDSVNGGLQVLQQNVWIDVPPVKGALLANIGDMMQIITNGKFKSVEHRVLLKPAVEPRLSVACFIGPDDLVKPYGPLKELVSENNPPIYGEVKFGEYMKKYKL